MESILEKTNAELAGFEPTTPRCFLRKSQKRRSKMEEKCINHRFSSPQRQAKVIQV